MILISNLQPSSKIDSELIIQNLNPTVNFIYLSDLSHHIINECLIFRITVILFSSGSVIILVTTLAFLRVEAGVFCLRLDRSFSGSRNQIL
jgi:hypothetical protein